METQLLATVSQSHHYWLHRSGVGHKGKAGRDYVADQHIWRHSVPVVVGKEEVGAAVEEEGADGGEAVLGGPE